MNAKSLLDWLVGFYLFAMLGPALAFGQSPSTLPDTVPMDDQLAQASGGERDRVFDGAGSAPAVGLPSGAPTVDKNGSVPAYSEEGAKEIRILKDGPELMKPAPEPPKTPAPGWATGLGIGVAAGGAGLIGAAAYAGLHGGSLLGLAPALGGLLGGMALLAGISILVVFAVR